MLLLFCGCLPDDPKLAELVKYDRNIIAKDDSGNVFIIHYNNTNSSWDVYLSSNSNQKLEKGN